MKCKDFPSNILSVSFQSKVMRLLILIFATCSAFIRTPEGDYPTSGYSYTYNYGTGSDTTNRTPINCTGACAYGVGFGIGGAGLLCMIIYLICLLKRDCSSCCSSCCAYRSNAATRPVVVPRTTATATATASTSTNSNQRPSQINSSESGSNYDYEYAYYNDYV